MKKQMIEVEGLPEGWKAVEIRVDPDQYNKYVGDDGCLYWEAKIKMEKIQPRRIVLEEINRDNALYASGNYETQVFNNGLRLFNNPKIWREVKETNEEPMLSLTKKDMTELIEHIKLGGQLNHKIAEFINYEQPEPKLSLILDEKLNVIFDGLHKAIDKIIKEKS